MSHYIKGLPVGMTEDFVINYGRSLAPNYGDIASVKVLSTPEADMDAVHTTAALVLSSPEEMRT